MFDLVLEFLGAIGANFIPPTTFLEFFPWLFQWLFVFFIINKLLDIFKNIVGILVRGANSK